MNVKATFLAIGIISFACLACVRESPQIKVIAEQTAPKMYSFRWEVLPPINGTVKIYSSLDPEHFDLSAPHVEAPIFDGTACFPVEGRNDRYFFLLKFNNRHKKIIGNRFVYSARIQNLRDIGGYQNKEEKTIKWAKIYRSGNIKVPMEERDICLTNQLGIRTIIGFYSKNGENYAQENPHLNNIHYINTHIPDPIVPEIINLILDGRMRKGDVMLYLQEQYLDMYENADIYFNPMFNALLEETNYPILLTDERGVGRTGFATALLMAAIDIPDETIVEDYMLSKNQIDVRACLFRKKATLFFAQQEAIVCLHNPQEKALSMIRSRINRDFGSMDNYLEKKLKLDKTKRKKLKQLLLY